MTVYLAFECSERFGGALEDETQEIETQIDADADEQVLVARVNAHFAKEEIIRFNRGQLHKLEDGKRKSNRLFGTGGGCDYYKWLEIRTAWSLT